ncbi:RHS repeat-associated core domain-containing protein [Sorangium sp. So ce1182]|uniref:RHS repeat-associated core domain-containing protein n=1 Tax=Sorangium sp. So ce1182 TaxID=3133334 RepID=UPI003F5FA38D
MNTRGNAATGAAAAAGNQAEAPKPPESPTGNASLDVLAGDIKDAKAAFEPLSDPEATNLEKANAAIGGTLNAVMLPITLLNDGFALATRDIGKLIELPAATLGMLHLGIPHVHLHPPAMPIPLPSFGPVALAGCASVLINGIPAARAGDMGISLLCGTFAPPFQVFTGSSKVFFGGARAARMLDITMHCMPGAGAARAMATLMKVASVGMGVVGVGAEALDAVTKAERAKRLRAKKVEPKTIDPGEAAKMTPEELAAAQEAAAAEAAEEQQENLEEASADEASAKITGIQAGLDAAALALSLLMGLDPGTPPCIGAVLTGHPNVLIGGFPMPPWSAVARGLGKLGRKPRRKGQKIKRSFKCDREGHPVNPVTGANVGECVDYEEAGPLPFRWGRSYSSANADREGPMGRGFRHTYEHGLAVDLDRVVYTDPEGQDLEIPLPGPKELQTFRDGYGLRLRVEEAHVYYELSRRGEPTIEFVRERRSGAAPRLSRLLSPAAHVDFLHDALGRMSGMLERARAATIETRLVLDQRGHVVEVRRGPRGDRELPLIAAYSYDHASCLSAWQDPLGAREVYAYDAARRLSRITYRNGYSFHYTYDEQGRCIEEHGDDGLWRVALRYEPEQRRTLVTRADGGEWIYQFDGDGTITSIRDPYGGTIERTLDKQGQVVGQVGPGARSLRFLHDASSGEILGAIDEFDTLRPPLGQQPNPPDPLEHLMPETAREQQWGRALAGVETSLSWLPADVRAAGLALLGAPRPQRAPERRLDALGRVVEEVDASGRLRSWSYDPSGNVVRHVDRDGREHRRLISSWNLVGATVDPLGRRTLYDHTAREKVARVIDPGGSESRYEYDLKDRLSRVVRHGVVREEYTYDHNDCLIEKRDGAGNVMIRCSIGDNGLPAERRLATGEVHRYAYDARGRTTGASTAQLEVRREFDRRGRLVLDERGGRGVRHRFESGLLCETTTLGRFTVVYRRTQDGSLLIETPVGGVHRIRRCEQGSLVAELGNGTSVLSAYDDDGRCQGRMAWRRRGDKVALWWARYTYSAEGELLRIDDEARGVTEYAYDAGRRLVGESRPDGVNSPIVLDVAGNVLEKQGLPRAEVIEGNRISSAGRERFRYDARNHLAEHDSEAGETTYYHYDSLDMLVRVSWSGRSEAWTAAYDGIARRLYKELGGRRTEYFWDGDRLAAEVGPTGAARIYVYPGPEALVPLLFIDYESVEAAPESGRAYYVIGNQLGAPLHIEDQEGNVVWRANHVEPYGAITVHPGASISYAPRFPGHYFDEETGLHCNRHRYYSPRLGRYVQSDPVGQAGGVNLYAYPANPLVDVDLLGLFPCGFSSLFTSGVGRRTSGAESEPQLAPQPRPRTPDVPDDGVRDLVNDYIRQFDSIARDQSAPPLLRDILRDAVDTYNDRVIRSDDRPGQAYASRMLDQHGHLRGYGLDLNLGEKRGKYGDIPAESVLLHEITHIIVNEKYDKAFINHADQGARAPGDPQKTSTPVYVRDSEEFFGVRNEDAQQANAVNVDAVFALHKNLEAVRDDLRKTAGLSDAQKTFFEDQINYGKSKSHIEYDTVINQMYYAAYRWGIDPQSPLYTQLEALARDARTRRDNRIPVL